MTLWHLILLALIQGITEFLPISSSGHLILLPALAGYPDQGAFIDVAAHIGTLFAVLIYFKRDTAGLFYAGMGSIGISPARRKVMDTPYINLFWCLVIATLPTVGVGLILSKAGIIDMLRSPEVIASAFIFFGGALYFADMRGKTERTMDRIGLKTALQMGLAQCFALIPGASRAGVTMTAARLLGFDRVSAAHFSMLMSIPVIIASGTLATLDAFKDGSIAYIADATLVAALSCLFALIAIRFLMKWLERASMTLFVLYRIGFGVLLFGLMGAGYL